MEWTNVQASDQSVIAFDTETTGLDIYTEDEMWGFSWGGWDGNPQRIRADREPKRAAHKLKELWNGEAPLVCHNTKFDLGVARSEGITVDLDHPLHDTMVLIHMLEPDRKQKGLKRLCWELAGYPKDDDQKIKRYPTMRDAPDELVDLYMRRDAERPMLLYRFLSEKVEEAGLWDIYAMEMDLIKTTERMERRGVRLDPKATRNLHSWLEGELSNIQYKLDDIAGKPINVNSHPQMRKLLYNEWSLPILATTDTGAPTTKKEVLLKLEDDLDDGPRKRFLKLMRKFRSYANSAPIIKSYLGYADNNNAIHPHINTLGTVTGREACSSPNLQNVKKANEIQDPFPVPMRKCIRPRPGCVNIHVDYSGIQMRLIVAESGDPRMTEMFQNGEDPHRAAAKIFYAKRDPTKDERNAAKNANYAIGFGSGPETVADTVRVPLQQCERRYRTYCERFPGVANFSRSKLQEVRETGGVRTLFGRFIPVPSFKPYAGANYNIQGSEAGILKRAQVRVDRFLHKTTNDEIRILFPIHDELVLECPRKRLSDFWEIQPQVERLLTEFDTAVPMAVDWEISTRNWENLKEVNPNAEAKATRTRQSSKKTRKKASRKRRNPKRRRRGVVS